MWVYVCVLDGRQERVKGNSKWELLVELRRADFLLPNPTDWVDLNASKYHP